MPRPEGMSDKEQRKLFKGWLAEAKAKHPPVIQNGRIISGMTPRDRMNYAKKKWAELCDDPEQYIETPVHVATLSEAMEQQDQRGEAGERELNETDLIDVAGPVHEGGAVAELTS